jgi:hypothetical protein
VWWPERRVYRCEHADRDDREVTISPTRVGVVELLREGE